ncbi:MAG: ABC transporter permease [Pelobium sp.]
MKTFFLSLRSEYFKSRNTLSFWGAIILPTALCFLVFLGFYLKTEDIVSRFKGVPANGNLIWSQYIGAIMGPMGTLLLPVYLIFMTYSVNSIEHKAETWKSLFSLPIPKTTVYFSKALYTLLLVLISMVLFVSLSLGLGLLLGKLSPQLNMMDADVSKISKDLLQVYVKLYIASFGIIAVQFLFSLIWQDFMKPMGLGFVLLVASLIAFQWEYSYLSPFALPIRSIMEGKKELVFFTKELWISLAYAAGFFTLGYFIVTKRSVK